MKLLFLFIDIIIIKITLPLACIVFVEGVGDILFHLGIAKGFIHSSIWNEGTNWIFRDILLILISSICTLHLYKRTFSNS